MMELTKISLAEQLKAELMERYGLREDQVHLELTISTTDLDLSRQLLKDFDKYNATGDNKYFDDKNQSSDSVFGEQISFISVHRKDGRYGQYVTEGENHES